MPIAKDEESPSEWPVQSPHAGALFFCVLLGAFGPGCQTATYLVEQGWGQLKILHGRERIDRVMARPRIAIAWTGVVFGAAMVVVSFITFWLGFKPAWFAVTGLVWGAILCTVSVAFGAARHSGDDAG